MNRLIILFAFALSSVSLSAQKKYVNDFLNIGVGARNIAMGGAVSASVKDITSNYWNPAGLRNLPSDFQLSLMHNSYLGLTNYDYFGLAYKLAKNKGNIGVSAIRYGVDDIPNTLKLLKPDGSIDYSTIATSKFSATDYAFLISYAKDLQIKKWAERDDIRLTIGSNAKIIHRRIGQWASAWGVGLDAGAKMQMKRWQFGLMVRDATTTATSWAFSFTEAEKQILKNLNNVVPASSSEIMTPRITLGVAKTFILNDKVKLLTELDADFTTDGARYGSPIVIGKLSGTPKIGAEASFKNIFFLRAGLNGYQTILDDRDTTFTKTVKLFQPAIGVGFYINNLTIDYAFTSLTLTDNPLYSHVFSVKMDIRKPKSFRKDANRKRSNAINTIEPKSVEIKK
jgi:hypothetical protein